MTLRAACSVIVKQQITHIETTNEVADDLAKEAAEGAPHCELEKVSDAVRW